LILFRYLLLALLSISLLACGPVKDFTDQISERIVGQDPIDPPVPLKEFKAKLNPKITLVGKIRR
jgi:outer membrane protein assembly factor BamB